MDIQKKRNGDTLESSTSSLKVEQLQYNYLENSIQVELDNEIIKNVTQFMLLHPIHQS